ncbi:hypothetical protein BB560_002297 [Smittium megazygosporum]|uniref:Protein AF-9 homolog n=1 Tax=Smittium megazygosporum TaxID=133381 RepID=A0A2T9ZF70_9FUNG|nr:hypothetical protein BB560_002297 [Smittium megazygosporum]
MIKLFFPACSGEKPITLFHLLRLHPKEVQQPGELPKEVDHIIYDELVFSDPTEEFYELLLKNGHPGLLQKSDHDHPFSLELEKHDAEVLDAAIEQTKLQHQEYKLQLETMEREIAVLKKEISILENYCP